MYRSGRGRAESETIMIQYELGGMVTDVQLGEAAVKVTIVQIVLLVQ